MNRNNRNLGAVEKVFWLLDQVSQVHFAFAAEISGVKSEAEWQTAINAVQKRHPLLTACISGSDEVNPVFHFTPVH